MSELADGEGVLDDAVDLAPPVIVPRSYQHVTKALYERAWAIQPQMLAFMGDLVRFRSAGGAFTPEQIVERLAAAREANGPRAGSVVASGVAVIPMYGVISQRTNLMSEMSGGTSIAEMRESLREALSDSSVRAVVFDIDSPGGSVDGVPEFAAELRSLRRGQKPIVAQVNTLAASAAYWLASSMSEIVTTQSGEVGSIGVYAMHEDISEAEAKAGVRTTFVSAGEFKTEGNQFEPLSDDARAHIQSQVDENFATFLSDVAKGRGVTVDAVAQGYGKGRTFLSKGALAAGMVDRIETLDATVARLGRPAAARRSAEVIPIPQVAEMVETPAHPETEWDRRVAAFLTSKRSHS